MARGARYKTAREPRRLPDHPSEPASPAERVDSRTRADDARSDHPGLKTLFVSGYPKGRGGVLEVFADQELLRKPFTPLVLTQRVRKILDKLDTFEGRSRFTTWAMTIATRTAISELRKRHFKDVSLDQIAGGDNMKFEIAADDEASSAATDSDRNEILMQLRNLIDNYLTDKQRTVIQAALSGMPMEEIARRMESNRNATYKLFHDARKKLRAGFESRGVEAADIQSVLA